MAMRGKRRKSKRPGIGPRGPRVASVLDAKRIVAEVAYGVPADTSRAPAMAIYVHRVGGGSPDQEYEGPWICELRIGGQLARSVGNFVTPPASHYMAAGMFADTLATGGVPDAAFDLTPHIERLEHFAREVNASARRSFLHLRPQQ
jgi:hypothetical protein